VGGGNGDGGKAGKEMKKVGKSKKKSLTKSFATWSSLVNKSTEKNLTKVGPYALIHKTAPNVLY
jgi:hypothetical protein